MGDFLNETSIDDNEKRRKRNRLSQRHFRERRNRHVKELEERIKFFTKNENERNARLILENTGLRGTLSEAKAQMSRLRSCLDDLYDMLDRGLEEVQPGSATNNIDEATWNSQTDSGHASPSGSFNGVPDIDNPEDLYQSKLPEQLEEPAQLEQQLNLGSDDWVLPIGGELIESQSFDCHLQHDPQLQTSEEMTAALCSAIRYDLPPEITIPPSLGLPGDKFSPLLFAKATEYRAFRSPVLRMVFEPQQAHLLQTLYYLLNQQFAAFGHMTLSEQIDGMLSITEDYLKLTEGAANPKIINQACLLAMMLFAKHSSPLPAVMWFCSSCYVMVAHVIRWRLSRALHIPQRLPQNYEPTKLQDSIKHPSIIDWLAIGGLRDRLIHSFNHSAKIDQMFVDIMAHTVVEVADISTILTNAREGPGYLGVWNIFSAMIEGISNPHTQPNCTPNSLELHDGSLLELYQLHELPTVDTASVARQTTVGEGFWKPVPLSVLLGSPHLARQLYHHLELYNAHKCWKFDPVLFNIYPALKWDGYEKNLARGKSYRVSASWVAATQAAGIVV